MTTFKKTLLWTIAAVSLSVVLYFGLRSSTPTTLGALPIFQNFQLLNVVGLGGSRYGVVLSDGISTSTLKASSTPTLAGLTATSSINVTGTASSTFAGGVDVARLCITGSTTCFGAGGGSSISVTATSTIAGNDLISAFTKISVVSGDKLVIIATCSHSAPGRNYYLRVQNSTGTSTLSAFSLSGNAFSANTLTGLYIASSTVSSAYVEIYDETSVGTLACRDPQFLILKI